MSGTNSSAPVLQLQHITYTFARAIVAYVEYMEVKNGDDEDPSPEQEQRMVMAQSLFARMGLTPCPKIVWSDDFRDSLAILVRKLEGYRTAWLAAKNAAVQAGRALNRSNAWAENEADKTIPADSKEIRDYLNQADSKFALDQLRSAFKSGNDKLSFADPTPEILCRPPTTDLEKWSTLSEAALAIEAETKREAAKAALARTGQESVYGRVEAQPVFDMDNEEYEQSVADALADRQPSDPSKAPLKFVPPQAGNTEGIYGVFRPATIDAEEALQAGQQDYLRTTQPFE